MKIDLDELTKAIRNMKRYQPIYKILKRELTQLGFWRNRPRGNPAKGYALRGSKGKANDE